MSSLQWLNDLAQWLGRLFPRLSLVPPTHSGVMFGPKGGVTLKGPGLIPWWPLVQLLNQVDVSVGSMDVAAVSMLVDGDEMIPRVAFVGTVVRWQIVDPCKAARLSLDIKRLVDNSCQSAMGKHWTGIDAADDAVEKAFAETREELLGEFGVELLSLKRSHLGVGVGLLQLADWTNTSNTDSRLS